MKLKKDDKPVEKKKETLGNILKMVEIIPLKDFPSGIHQNQWHFEIKEGVPVTIPRHFLPNMVTEGVIKEIPKLKK